MPSIKKALMKAKEDWRKLSIGALLIVFPLVGIVGAVYAYGYLIAYSNSVQKGKANLPDWKDWKRLFGLGLKSILLNLILALPLLVLIALVFLTLLVTSDFNSMVFLTPMWLLYLAFGAMVVMVFLLVYLLPAAQVRFAKEMNINKALNIKELWAYSFRWEYFATFVKTFATTLLIMSLAALLEGVTALTIVLPFVIEAYVLFACQIIVFSMFSWLAVESKKR